jgi:RNA polymerase sigma-70 factor (ECF subfamily)
LRKRQPWHHPNELSCFLESVERRAFKQAMFAVREEEAPSTSSRTAMLKLAEKYGDRPDEEFPMLFQRILQNTIRDFYRRSKVRSMWTTLLSAFSPDDDEDTTRWKRWPPTKMKPAQERRKASCCKPKH